MKPEPRPAIFMEKQLGWARKWGSVEPLGISKVGQTVLARFMESQIQHQLAGSVWMVVFFFNFIVVRLPFNLIAVGKSMGGIYPIQSATRTGCDR